MTLKAELESQVETTMNTLSRILTIMSHVNVLRILQPNFLWLHLYRIESRGRIFYPTNEFELHFHWRSSALSISTRSGYSSFMQKTHQSHSCMGQLCQSNNHVFIIISTHKLSFSKNPHKTSETWKWRIQKLSSLRNLVAAAAEWQTLTPNQKNRVHQPSVSRESSIQARDCFLESDQEGPPEASNRLWSLHPSTLVWNPKNRWNRPRYNSGWTSSRSRLG